MEEKNNNEVTPAKTGNSAEKKEFSKGETLAFIDWLRTRENVIIDENIIQRHSFFNRWKENTSGKAKAFLDVIRKAQSTQMAYEAIAHLKGRENCLWKTFPEGGYMFQEDWEEYRETHPDPLPEHVQKWQEKANGLHSRANGLYRRSILFELFPTEYLIFQHRYETIEEQKLTVSEIQLSGAYNAYRYRFFDAKTMDERIGQSIAPAAKKISLFFSSEASGIETSDVVPMAKFLCETYGLDQVCIMDKNADTVTVVRKMN